jgi:hypothetical protein
LLGYMPPVALGGKGRGLVLVSVAMTLFACMPPPYRTPTANQPHAVMKIRRSYEVTAGVALRERVSIDEHLALSEERPSELARQAATDAILVHPRPGDFVVESQFSHIESRTVDEPYYEQESYMDAEQYPCGGFGESSRTCTRPVTRFRSVPQTRSVTRMEEVSDGSCRRTIRLAPAVGRTYLLQYTYQEDGACALSCFEQRASQEAGAFEQVQCSTAPHAEQD